jgi:hypothetical protein
MHTAQLNVHAVNLKIEINGNTNSVCLLNPGIHKSSLATEGMTYGLSASLFMVEILTGINESANLTEAV